MTVLRSGSASDVGQVRTVNQDLALEAPNLFAVADGMGGHAGGEVAARLAVEALREQFDAQPTAEGLIDAVAAANSAVWSEGQEQAELHGMGTTLTAAALVANSHGDDVVALVNVGDSRAYVFRNRSLTQITSDHSLAEERVRQGALTEAEAAVHPHRHILTRALGIGPGVDVDLWELHLHPGDRLVLCSDGLTNEVSDDEIATALSQSLDPDAVAHQLVDEANRRGGSDNITVVVVDVMQDGGKSKTKPPGADSALGRDVVAGTTAGAAVAGVGAAAGAGIAAGSSGTSPMDPGAPPLDNTGAVPVVGRGAPPRPADPTLATPRGVVVAPGAPPPPLTREDDGQRRSRRRKGQPRRITVRVVLFVLLLGAVVAGAYYFVRWYAMDAYYVGVKGNQLVVYQGRPGGVLWFKPHIVDRTGVTTTQIPAINVPTVRATVPESSLAASRRYVRNLRQEKLAQQSGGNSGPSASGSTTSTAPPITPLTSVPPASTPPPSVSNPPGAP